MVIDTACSSTMVSLHQAVLSLKANEASMALVCGANLILNPDMVSNFCPIRAFGSLHTP